jgi:hypothetical protein
MSFDLGALIKNNKATLQTENGKIVLRISFDDLVQSMYDGLPEQSKKVTSITHDGKQVIISFDASLLSGIVKIVPK